MRIVWALALAALTGCVTRVRYVERPAGPASHVHDRACGHHYWHGEWNLEPHADGCDDPGWHLHVHRAGCGHEYWHGQWSDAAHPDACRDSRWHAVHDHAWGCGHQYWHDGWHDYAHPVGCRDER